MGPSRGPITFSYGPFEADTFIAGMPTIHVSATPHTANNGHIFVEMTDDAGIHLGHAVMDLRFHAGGRDGVLQIAPFTTVVAKMEFMPLMYSFLRVSQYTSLSRKLERTTVPSPAAAGEYSIDWAASTLTLPLVERSKMISSKRQWSNMENLQVESAD